MDSSIRTLPALLSLPLHLILAFIHEERTVNGPNWINTFQVRHQADNSLTQILTVISHPELFHPASVLQIAPDHLPLRLRDQLRILALYLSIHRSANFTAQFS